MCLSAKCISPSLPPLPQHTDLFTFGNNNDDVIEKFPIVIKTFENKNKNPREEYNDI